MHTIVTLKKQPSHFFEIVKADSNVLYQYFLDKSINSNLLIVKLNPLNHLKNFLINNLKINNFHFIGESYLILI